MLGVVVEEAGNEFRANAAEAKAKLYREALVGFDFRSVLRREIGEGLKGATTITSTTPKLVRRVSLSAYSRIYRQSKSESVLFATVNYRLAEPGLSELVLTAEVAVYPKAAELRGVRDKVFGSSERRGLKIRMTL